MRIAYITDRSTPADDDDGAAPGAGRSVEFLRARGHGVELIRPVSRDERPLDSSNEWRIDAGWGLPFVPSLAARLRTRLFARRQHLVHLAGDGTLARAALAAARSLGIPVTSDLRTGPCDGLFGGWPEPIELARQRAFHNRTDRSFVPTRALRDRLAERGFERLETTGSAVDTERFQPGRRSAALRSDWGAGSQDCVMLFVGALTPRNDPMLALRAWSAIRLLRPSTRMVVVGDGPLRERLQAQYPDARFAGRQHGAALARHYASADLFAWPSASDLLGCASLRAMASGLAVVAADAGAAAEQITAGDTGLLVAPGDDSGFIAATARAAAQSEPHAWLRLRAREAALSASFDAMLRRFDLRLERLATAAPRRAAALAAA